MTYRATKKRNKPWSQNANAKKEHLRLENAEPVRVAQWAKGEEHES